MSTFNKQCKTHARLVHFEAAFPQGPQICKLPQAQAAAKASLLAILLTVGFGIGKDVSIRGSVPPSPLSGKEQEQKVRPFLLREGVWMSRAHTHSSDKPSRASELWTSQAGTFD